MTVSRALLLALGGLSLAFAGCSSGTSPQGASGTGSSARPAPSQAESDLGFLRFAFTEPRYGKPPERMPKDLDDAASQIKVVDERIYARVKQGLYVIRWGEPMTAPVLAYEKDAPTQGGWVLRGTGMIEKMSAEQLKKLLGQKAG